VVHRNEGKPLLVIIAVLMILLLTAVLWHRNQTNSEKAPLIDRGRQPAPATH
jgi:hypothetical protein